MKSLGIRQWLQYILLVTAAIALTCLAFRGQDFASIRKEVAKSDWFWIWAAIFFSFVGHIIRALRWRLLIQANGETVGLLATIVAMMLGYLSNLAVPRLGEFTRCGSLNRLSGISVLSIGGTVVAERAVDMICLLLIVFATILMAGTEIQAFSSENIIKPLLEMSQATQLLSILILTLGILFAAIIFFWLNRKLKAANAKTGPILWIRQLWSGLLSAFKLRQKTTFFVYTILIWLLYYTGPLCALLALDMGGNAVFEISLYVFVFGSIARTIPIPGGSAGAYHLIISNLLLIYGFSEVAALGLATLNHITQTLFQFIFGILAAVVFVFMLRNSIGSESKKHS